MGSAPSTEAMHDDAALHSSREQALQQTTVMERSNHTRGDAVYKENKTVFGAILRGDLPAKVLYEDNEVLCFRDIRPVSDLHALVIPKRCIENVGHCSARDISLLEHMVAVAKKVAIAEHPEIDDVEDACSTHTLSLGFHRWPMLSVYHLHLHCIYPMPCKWAWHRFLHPQVYGAFYLSAADELARLEALLPVRIDSGGVG